MSSPSGWKPTVTRRRATSTSVIWLDQSRALIQPPGELNSADQWSNSENRVTRSATSGRRDGPHRGIDLNDLIDRHECRLTNVPEFVNGTAHAS